MENNAAENPEPNAMSDVELKKLLHLVANELNARLERGAGLCKRPTQETVNDNVADGIDVELCDALFAVSAATQAAIIANNCPGP